MYYKWCGDVRDSGLRSNCCSAQPTVGLRFSFEHLIREAVKYGVVQYYEDTPTLTRLEMGGHVIELDPYHARLLLCNRLRAEGVATIDRFPLDFLDEAGVAA